MSRPLNPNAQSFLPKSSLIPLIHFPNPTVNPPSSLLSPTPDFLPVLPQYPPLHHHLQVPSFYHQFPSYPSKEQEICYGFPPPSPPPPPPPPPPSKLVSDYTHHGSMMIMGTLNLYSKGSSNGTTTDGYCLKTSTGRSRRCKKLLLLPPPPPPPAHHRRPSRPSSTSSCTTSTKKQWQRKSVVLVNGGGGGATAASAPANVVDVPKPPQSSSGGEVLEPIQQFGKKTSVMIKNIPNRYCREMLLELLLDHCKKENGKEKSEEEEEEEDLKESAFDFVYLPIDFETGCNKGYAFVNFTNPNGVWALHNFLTNHKWDVFNSRKICEVTYARIQGKEALIKHFNRSTFACEKDEYLPVSFMPYLDGSVQDEAVEVVTVGTRLMPSSSSQHLSILRRGDDDGEEDQPRTMA